MVDVANYLLSVRLTHSEITKRRACVCFKRVASLMDIFGLKIFKSLTGGKQYQSERINMDEIRLDWSNTISSRCSFNVHAKAVI